MNRRRLLLTGLTAIVALCVASGAAFYLVARASLPQLAGNLVVHGIHDDITIARDSTGVPTATARTRRDLAFATGYAHGQDRFFQMDLLRRRAAGELSALFGAVAVDADRQLRVHRFRYVADAIFEQLPNEHRELLQAYAAGVNAATEALRIRSWEYLLLRAQPEPWTAQDCLLVAFSMYLELNDSSGAAESARALARGVAPSRVRIPASPRHGMGCRYDGRRMARRGDSRCSYVRFALGAAAAPTTLHCSD